MNCLKCKTKNLDTDQFCKRCGTNLYDMKQMTNSESSDTLILTFIILTLSIGVIRFLAEKLVHNWFEPPVQYIFIAMNIISGFSFILVALAIKKETTRTTGMILAVIYGFYILFLNAQWLLGV